MNKPETVLLSLTQDSVNALYTKCLQCLLRDARLVSMRWQEEGHQTRWSSDLEHVLVRCLDVLC